MPLRQVNGKVPNGIASARPICSQHLHRQYQFSNLPIKEALANPRPLARHAPFILKGIILPKEVGRHVD